MDAGGLTLKKAFKTSRLDDFFAQEEARGVGPVDQGKLDTAIRAIVKPQRLEDRTSRSPGRGCSSGT